MRWLLGCLTVLSLHTAANDLDQKVAAYGHLPAISQVSLSPDGHYLSYVKNVQGSLRLIVRNLSTGKETPVLESDNKKVVFAGYDWANNDILLLNAIYTERDRDMKYSLGRLYKVDLSQANPKPEFAVKFKYGVDSNEPQFQNNIISMLPKQPDKILIAAEFENHRLPSVYEVNVRNGSRRKTIGKRNDVFDWIADQDGEPRIAIAYDDLQVTHKLRDPKSDKLTPLFSCEALSENCVSVIGFDSDPNILYVTKFSNDKKALFKYDLSDSTHTFTPVYANPDYDFDGHLLRAHDTGQVIGLYDSNSGYQFWDERRATLLKAIDKALPDYDNHVVDMSNDGNRYVVFSANDAVPGMYLLGDRANKTLEVIAETYPLLVDVTLPTKRLINFTARDGLNIEGYLTQPAQVSANKPAIILPHGGPNSRDYGDFDYWSQWFVSQGYTVLQPNFRGSDGYGFAFQQSSYGGWGKGMQDDLQDATDWLIKQGHAKADNICIVGGSYGGYAAMMALAKYPSSYQCAVSVAGVSDVEEIYKQARHYRFRDVERKSLGNDASALAAVSPVNLISAINKPLLLIHGDDDKVVPVAQSRVMYQALKAAQKDVQYIELEDGNHHLSYQPHRMETLKASMAFNNQHLKL